MNILVLKKAATQDVRSGLSVFWGRVIDFSLA